MKPVWLMATKIVCISLFQHRRLVTNRYFQSTAQYDAALLTLMCNRMLAGTGTRLIALLHELNCMIAQIGSNLSVGDTTVSNLGQFIGTKKKPLADFKLVGKKLAETDRKTVQNFF